MKEKIKNLPIIGTKLVGIYSWYLRIKDKKYLAKNRELKNKFAGKRCFVIATGPSIKNQDLKNLSRELCISVSNFFLHPDFHIIKPEFHLFVPSHLPLTNELFVAWMKDAEKHFSEGQKVFISITDKHIVDKFNLLKQQNIYYYYVEQKPPNSKKEIDISIKIPAIKTSPQIAMNIALYLGAQEIYLLGCDHDWILHVNDTRHFYDEKESRLSQLNYNEWTIKDMQERFRSYYDLWERYKELKRYAEKRKVKIYNCSPTSLLDVYPRKKFEDIL